MKINRKLLLITDIYGVFSYAEILEQIDEYKRIITEFNDILSRAKRFKILLEETEQDTFDIDDKIRDIEIQMVYVNENYKTCLDALSLCELEVVHEVFLVETNGWVEICDN